MNQLKSCSWLNSFMMSDQPLVSIIIPCFNSEDFVERAIASALNQQYDHTEIILVDNNSSDGTFKVLQNYKNKFPEKIKAIQEMKPGPSAARNAGLELSNGQYVQFLDSDDEIASEKINHQVNLITRDASDLVIGNYFMVNGRKKRISANQNPWIGLITSKLGITSANLWKIDAVMMAGAFNEYLSSSVEYDLLFRMLQSGARVSYDSGYYTCVFSRIESVGKSNDPERQLAVWRNIFDLRLQIRTYLMERDLFSGNIRSAWEKYMYAHLVHMKDKFPSLNQEYMPLLRHHLPLHITLKPFVYKELKRIFGKILP